MLILENISKIYKTNKEEIRALDSLSLSYSNKGLIFITGASGSGKSTLLNMIGGLSKPTNGKIVFAGNDYNKLSVSEMDCLRRKYIGFVFQSYNLIDDETVFSNLELSLNLGGSKDVKRIYEVLEAVDLTGFQDRKCNELSGGQRQRVAIARALINNPKMILCDEPTGALDKTSSLEVAKLLKKISKRCLVLVASHDIAIATTFADRIIDLVDGRVNSDKTINYFIDSDQQISLNGKANLPFKRILKSSLEILKINPLKLITAVMVMILTLASFITILSTTKDRDVALLNQMEADNEGFVLKTYDSYYYPIKLDYYNSVSNLLGKENVMPIYRMLDRDIGTFGDFKYDTKYEKSVFGFPIMGMMEINQEFIDENGYTLYGSLPKKDNDIVITDYYYNLYKMFRPKSFEFTSKADFIGNTIKSHFHISSEYRFKNFRITGILDTKLDTKRYLNLNNLDNEKIEKNPIIFNEISKGICNSIHNVVFLGENTINSINADCKDTAYFASTTFLNESDIYKMKRIKNYNLKLYKFDENDDRTSGVYVPLSYIRKCEGDFDFARLSMYSYISYKNNQEYYMQNCPQIRNDDDLSGFILTYGYDPRTNKTLEQLGFDYLKEGSFWYKNKTIFDEFPILGFVDDCENSIDYLLASDDVIDYALEHERQPFHYSGLYIKPTKSIDKYNVLLSLDNKNKINLYSIKLINNNMLNQRMFDFDNSGIMLALSVAILAMGAIFMGIYFSKTITDYSVNIGIYRSIGISKGKITLIFLVANMINIILVLGLSMLAANLMRLIVNDFTDTMFNALIKPISFSYIDYLLMILVSFATLTASMMIPLNRFLRKEIIDNIRSEE